MSGVFELIAPYPIYVSIWRGVVTCMAIAVCTSYCLVPLASFDASCCEFDCDCADICVEWIIIIAVVHMGAG